jgi:hypothetical protein
VSMFRKVKLLCTFIKCAWLQGQMSFHQAEMNAACDKGDFVGVARHSAECLRFVDRLNAVLDECMVPETDLQRCRRDPIAFVEYLRESAKVTSLADWKKKHKA